MSAGGEPLSILYALRGRVHRAHLVVTEEGVRLHGFGGQGLEPRESLVLLVPARPLDAKERALLAGAVEAGYRAES